jgi:hypothetical protein
LAVWAEREDATHVEGMFETDRSRYCQGTAWAFSALNRDRYSMTSRSSARDPPVSRLRCMPHRTASRSSFRYARIRWASRSQCAYRKLSRFSGRHFRPGAHRPCLRAGAEIRCQGGDTSATPRSLPYYKERSRFADILTSVNAARVSSRYRSLNT